jgi:hypothetical protein
MRGSKVGGGEILQISQALETPVFITVNMVYFTPNGIVTEARIDLSDTPSNAIFQLQMVHNLIHNCVGLSYAHTTTTQETPQYNQYLLNFLSFRQIFAKLVSRWWN